MSYLNASLGAGDRRRIGTTRSFVVPAATGDSWVEVLFAASEWDKNILGMTYPDSRLNGVAATRRHALKNGSWSNTGSQTITVGSGDCQVELEYSASER